MKLQKTILAASLAIVAANAAFASGENPVIDQVHHVISKSDANLGNYAKVYFDVAGNIITNAGQHVFGADDALITRGVNNEVLTVNGTAVRDQGIEALDYLYRELKLDPVAPTKRAELQAIYDDLNGGVVDIFDATTGYFNTSGKFQSQRFVTEEVPLLDIYADENFSNVNGYHNNIYAPTATPNQNIVSPVYGRDTILGSLQSFGGMNGIDLNSRKAIVENTNGKEYQLVKYGTGANAVYQFFDMTTDIATGEPAFADFYKRDASGNLVKTAVATAPNRDTITMAGQYTLSTSGKGEEIKLITDEHLTYGFKSTQDVTGLGTITDTNNVSSNQTETYDQGDSVENVTGESKSKYDNVNVGDRKSVV